MEIILLIIAALVACFGLYLIFDFLFRRITGHVVKAEIAGFQNKKDKGRPLPVVRFKTSETERTEKVAHIEHLGYLLSPRPAGTRLPVLYHKGTKNVVLYGYANLLLGLALLLPLLMVSAAILGKTQAYAQSFFLILLALMILGAWGFMRLIQKYY